MAKDRARDPRRSVETYMKGKEKMGRALGYFTLPGTEKHGPTVIGHNKEFAPGAGHVSTGKYYENIDEFAHDTPETWRGQKGLK